MRRGVRSDTTVRRDKSARAFCPLHAGLTFVSSQDVNHPLHPLVWIRLGWRLSVGCRWFVCDLYQWWPLPPPPPQQQQQQAASPTAIH